MLIFLPGFFFCMISLYCFWQIINIEKILMTKPLWAAFLYATFFFVTLCLISWVIIILVSRTYLHRLHSEWKFRSFKEYEAKKRKGSMRRLAMDKISVGLLDLMISIATLVANIVTAWAILTPWLKLFWMEACPFRLKRWPRPRWERMKTLEQRDSECSFS